MKLKHILLLVSAFLVVGCSNIKDTVFKQSEVVECDYAPVKYSIFSDDGQLNVVDQCESFDKAHLVRVLRLNVVNHNVAEPLECDITYSEFKRTVWVDQNSGADLFLWFHTKVGEKPKFNCQTHLDLSSLF